MCLPSPSHVLLRSIAEHSILSICTHSVVEKEPINSLICHGCGYGVLEVLWETCQAEVVVVV